MIFKFATKIINEILSQTLTTKESFLAKFTLKPHISTTMKDLQIPQTDLESSGYGEFITCFCYFIWCL
jgi:hypothetical protein